MARKAPARKAVRRSAAARKTSPRRSKTARAGARASRAPRAAVDTLLGPMKGAEHHSVGGVEIDVACAGAARVKRTVYPAGFQWSKNMKPVTGTDTCMHAHVGFLARGRIHMMFADGCILDFKAPAIVAIEPGHDGRVVGGEPAVLIEFDFEKDTVAKLGMPQAHAHS
jgi:hypothetical protein